MPPGGDLRAGAAARTTTRSRLAALGERLFVEPARVGGRRLPPLGLVVLAAIGASLLVITAQGHWPYPNDEHAYWLAGQRLLHGQPLYDPTMGANTPFAYWYPPVVAQVMAPLSAIVPSDLFSLGWTVLLFGCLWWLAGGRPLVAFAMLAFLPVATELGWFRNVHLVLAVLIVLGFRRWPAAFAVGAAIKLAPGLGILWLAARGRWRDAAVAVAIGLAILLVSVAISPSAWAQFIDVLRARGPGDVAALIPIPFGFRAILAAVIVVAAGRMQNRWSEPLAALGIVVALPTLWFTALSTLAALVPLWPGPKRSTEPSPPAGTKERPVLAGGRGVGSSG